MRMLCFAFTSDVLLVGKLSVDQGMYLAKSNNIVLDSGRLDACAMYPHHNVNVVVMYRVLQFSLSKR